MKRIDFPEEEIAQLRRRDTIITHRVSSDFGKYRINDVVLTPWGQQYRVTGRRAVASVSQSPFAKFLTAEQLAFLAKFGEIDVLRLERK